MAGEQKAPTIQVEITEEGRVALRISQREGPDAVLPMPRAAAIGLAQDMLARAAELPPDNPAVGPTFLISHWYAAPHPTLDEPVLQLRVAGDIKLHFMMPAQTAREMGQKLLTIGGPSPSESEAKRN